MAFEDLFSSLGGLFGSTDSTQTGQPKEAGANPLASILLGVGAPLISKLMSRGEDKQINKATKNIQTGANTGTSIGEQLLKRAAAGQLTDPQKAQVDTMKREQNARANQYLASLGIPVSTAMVQSQNKIDEDATAFANKLIDQSFQQGIQAMNLGGQASQVLLQSAMAQKKELANTIGDVAKQIGQVMNTPGRTEQPAQTAQDTISSGAQSWGAGDFDPYAETIPAGVDYT